MPEKIGPKRIRPDTNSGYFEILTKAVFQAGFSFKVVRDKWPGITRIFHKFDTKKIASWGDLDIIDALETPDIIRNTKKIKATVDNAIRFEEIVSEYGIFSSYIDEIQKLPYEERKNSLTSNFKWLGKTGAYFFLYSINDDVPKWDER